MKNRSQDQKAHEQMEKMLPFGILLRTSVMTAIMTTVIPNLAYPTPTMCPNSSYTFLYYKVGGIFFY